MVTIYSIAQRCQVSAATVSRAFSRPEMVSDDLRDRILRTADEMGYRVNRNARRLARGTSGLVAVVIPDITNPYFPPLIRALGTLLDADGSSLLMVDTAGDPERELTMIHRLAGDVDGFVLISPRANLRSLQTELHQTRAVLIHRPGRTLNHVLADESQAIGELFELLKTRGRAVVGYVGGPRDSWINSRRLALARASAATTGIALVDLGAHAATLEAGDSAATAIIDARIDAVLAFDDTLALGVVSGLASRGVRVPDDVVIGAFDDLSQSALVRPSISSIAADPALIAESAQTLLAASSPGQLQGRSSSVSATLHVRESLGT